MRNIKELIDHIEEQMNHNDAREPSCKWITSELKKYLISKESCQWCEARVEGKVLIELDDDCKVEVCQACAWDYVKGNFDAIKKKIKKPDTTKDDDVTTKLPELGSKVTDT